MKLGFGIPVSGSWATPANIVEISLAAERLGYESLWSFQRTIYPYDDSIPVPYRSVHDPLAVSAYVAGVTERVRIGLAIVNLPFYSPLVLAKMLTSIDLLFAKVSSGHGKLVNDGKTSYKGRQVVAIRDASDSSKLYVAATGKPYPVALVGGTKGQSGTITFGDWNKSVSLSAPKDAIDISQLGAG